MCRVCVIVVVNVLLFTLSVQGATNKELVNNAPQLTEKRKNVRISSISWSQ